MAFTLPAWLAVALTFAKYVILPRAGMVHAAVYRNDAGDSVPGPSAKDTCKCDTFTSAKGRELYSSTTFVFVKIDKACDFD